MTRVALLLGGLVALLAIPVVATAHQSTAASLAQATQNPVSDLVSVPFQYNVFSGGGLGGRWLVTLNGQPVLPLSIGKRWNIIARTTVPYVSALPTATAAAVRTDDWTAGPDAVALTVDDPFVLGVLLTQIWTIAADDEGSDINQLTVQPFVNWNLANSWTISFNPTMTASWEAASVWTLPLGLGVSNVTAIGPLPVSVGLTYVNDVVRPPGTGSSQVRLVSSFLFPKASVK